ncbi:MAG: hypothetical protein ABL958_12950, partial [Bdellovibrionia bacterium]
ISYTNAMTISAAGNVGIATTSPTDKLSVIGQIAVDNTDGGARGCFRYSGTVMEFANNCESGTPTWTAIGSGGGSSSGTTGHVQISGGGGAFTSDSNMLFWDSTNDRLGLGTETPNTALHISSTAPVLQLQATGGVTSSLMFNNSSSTSNETAKITVEDAGSFKGVMRFLIHDYNGIGTANEVMRIHSDGNLGIRATNPGTALDVNGALTVRGMTAPAQSSAGTVRFYFDSGSNTLKLSENNTAYSNILTAANTNAFTNKTYDVEATGNVFSMPVKTWLPAAGCSDTTPGAVWDLPTTTPAVAACITGTNIQKGVLHFADTSGGFSAQMTHYLPADWSTTGGVDVNLAWTTAATSGDAKWTVQFVCTDIAASMTDDPAFPSSGNGFNTVTTAAPGTAQRVQSSTITGATLPSNCISGTAQLLHIRVFRDGNDGSDTLGSTASFIGLNLTHRRAM